MPTVYFLKIESGFDETCLEDMHPVAAKRLKPKMELPFPTFFMNMYFPQRKCFILREKDGKYFVLRHATNIINWWFEKKSLRNNQTKNSFFNKIARDFAPVVYPIRSNWILTIFTPFEGSQSELSGNQNLIKIECDLTGSINAYSKSYKFHFENSHLASIL